MVLILCLSINSLSFAADDVISVEEESTESITYVLTGQNYNCFKAFIKYSTNSNQEEYWFRINLKFRDRLKPYMDVIIDNQKYQLVAVEEYKKRHLLSGSGTEIDGNYNYQDKECYIIPQEIISKILNSKSMSLIAYSQRKPKIEIESNAYFLNGIKEIINLKYENREPYFTNKTKVKISE